MDCLFCKIVKGEVAAKVLYQDDDVVIFPDINPKARVHLLVIPSMHIKSFLDLENEQLSMLTKMAKVIQSKIIENNLQSGYRLLINGGKNQHVPHLHWHLMGD
jgi:histidine triad (HIT) family protein